MTGFLEADVLMALATLTLLEIVLGIDNIVFISILAGRLPQAQQARARNLGLGTAIGIRVLLLLSITWIMQLTAPLVAVMGEEISGRDLILIAGGLFLLGKSSLEIHHNMEGEDPNVTTAKAVASFAAIMVQITIVNIVFSLDSVITAVGMTDVLWVMITAVVISGIFMMVAAAPVARFVEKHPTVKILALSFLILIGMALIGEGLEFHIPKGYIYFAMAFSMAVEMINLRVRKAHKPVQLKRQLPDNTASA
ncbi:TerC family protein [bacterium]|nr:TerC family protein [bacterium]